MKVIEIIVDNMDITRVIEMKVEIMDITKARKMKAKNIIMKLEKMKALSDPNHQKAEI